MTKRGADYKRRPGDDYPTPHQTTRDLLTFLQKDLSIYLCDPCPGPKKAMVKVFKDLGYRIVHGPKNFITGIIDGSQEFDIVTNPPYGDRRGTLAVKFIEKALSVTGPWDGNVVMLLPYDFDAAKTRHHLFEHRAFHAKLVMPGRVPWFRGKSGSTVHAWYWWNWKHKGRPTIRYMGGEG